MNQTKIYSYIEGQDMQNLIKNWDLIKENAMNSIAPALIHHESEFIKRTLMGLYYTWQKFDYWNFNRKLPK